MPLHFLEKNDMMLPCPDLPAGLALVVELAVELAEGFFLGGGAGSSSEKDSQPGSSTVTEGCQTNGQVQLANTCR